MITSLRKVAPLEFFHKDSTFHPLGNEVTGQRGSVRSEAREGDFVTPSIRKPRTRKENPPFFSLFLRNDAKTVDNARAEKIKFLY